MEMIRDNQVNGARGCIFVTALLLFALLAPQAFAQSNIDFPKTRDVEKVGWSNNLVPTRQVKATYPRGAAAKSKDGWVQMTYSIDSKGFVHDVVVVESYPEGVFEKNAVRALEKWEFAIPANMANAQFPMKRTIVFSFTMKGNNGVGLSVGKKLKRARNAIVDDRDAEAALKYLDEISEKANEDGLNLYELAALEQTFALLEFSKKEYEQAIDHAERALRFSKTLDEDNIIGTHRLLFFSYFNTNQFTDAVRVYDNWLELDQSVTEAKFTPMIEQIRSALNEGQEIVFE
jgi:TonB family protein